MDPEKKLARQMRRQRDKRVGRINLHCSACHAYIRQVSTKEFESLRPVMLCEKCFERVNEIRDTTAVVAQRGSREITRLRGTVLDLIEDITKNGFLVKGGKD